MVSVLERKEQNEALFSAAAIESLAKVLRLPKLQQEQAAALEKAALVYWFHYKLEDTAYRELRSRLKRAIKISQQFRDCFEFVDLPTWKILEALPETLRGFDRLAPQLTEASKALPTRGIRPKSARTTFVQNLADIFEAATRREAGLAPSGYSGTQQ